MRIRLFFTSFFILFFLIHHTSAQIDPSLLKATNNSDTARPDTSKHSLTMDAIYNRPFLKLGKTPVSIGGYMESDWQFVQTSGINIGNQFQFRRFSLFVASSISNRVKFLSEIEYEDDPTGDDDLPGVAPSFEVEYAALDIEFHPLVNLRAGMIVNPIGAFNQNHDGPKWEFTDRPVAMSQMLPDTWSNTGFGIYGKQYNKNWMFGYEFYVTGGFDDAIIDNAQGETYLPAAKASTTRFTQSASGTPMCTGKISVRNDKIGELGLSFMSDVYNTWEVEGTPVDNERTVNVYDVDFNTTINKTKTFITTEWALINIQIPPNYLEQYSSKQYGGFIDVVQPVLKGKILGWDNASLNVAVRGEYVDWNAGTFASTGTRMYNDLWQVTPAISFRPSPQTVLRFNYHHGVRRDITGNTIGASLGPTGGFSFGVATYF